MGESPLHQALSELVRTTGVAAQTIRRAIKKGQLRAFQPGGKGGTIYLNQSEFWAWFEGSAIAPRDDEPGPAGAVFDVEW